MVFLHSLNSQHDKAELAFNLARPHWNQGLATVSACIVLQLAFEYLSLTRLEATVMPENVGSRRVLEKIGMKHEGRMRRSHRRYDGFHDMDLFSVLDVSRKDPGASE